jgi:hypothetical protein
MASKTKINSTKKSLKSFAIKKKRLSASEVRDKAHTWRMASYCVMFLSLAVLAFNFTLFFTGGQDDLEPSLMVLAPALAVLASALALRNIVKYKSRKFELAASIVVLAIAGLCFCAELLILVLAAIMPNGLRDSDIRLSGRYNCADHQELLESNRYSVTMQFSGKEFRFWNYYNGDTYVNGSFSIDRLSDNEIKVHSLIAENHAKGSKMNLDATSYNVKVNDFRNIEITYEDGSVRYCKKD